MQFLRQSFQRNDRCLMRAGSFLEPKIGSHNDLYFLNWFQTLSTSPRVLHVFLPVRQFRRDCPGVHVSDCKQTVLRLDSLRESTEAQGQNVACRASGKRFCVSSEKPTIMEGSCFVM